MLIKREILSLVTYLAGSCLGLLAVVGAAESTASSGDTSIHHITSDICKACHKEIYRQWRGSTHAYSTAFNDPVHGAHFRKNVADHGKYAACLQCHAPNATRDRATNLDAIPAYSEGVNCIACHTLKNYKGSQSAGGKQNPRSNAYDYADKLQGAGRQTNNQEKNLTATGDGLGFGRAGEAKKPNPHLGEAVTMDGKVVPSIPMESNPRQMQTSDACLGCHNNHDDSHGATLCMAGEKYTQSESQVDCLTCHMPTSNGLADHSLGGGRGVAMAQPSFLDSNKEVALQNNSTMEMFCISCHKMIDTISEEIQETGHFTNRTGVRATCPDCHAAAEWSGKIKRKIQASAGLYQEFSGKTDAREKFEGERLRMALNVWKRMKANDSRECRNCHDYASMDLEKQQSRGADQHDPHVWEAMDGLEPTSTCIDCHKGVAHHLPKGWEKAVKEAGL